MIRSLSLLSPDVRALLDEERAISEQPAIVRARAMARARAALAAGIPAAANPPRVLVRPSWAASLTLACAIGVAVDLAAYQIHAHFARGGAPAAGAPAATVPAPAVAISTAPVEPTTVPSIDEALPPWTLIPPPRRSRSAEIRDELRLLRQARAAVARQDFAAALGPIAEHARRFKNGRLIEERVALWIRALVGLGRNREARHAAAGFRARFPHSVLLPVVDQLSPAAR